MASEMAVGLAMAQQMIQQQGGILGGNSPTMQPTGSSAPAHTPGPEVLTPADVARVLNVSEADVIAAIESGDLNGKKIGQSYRITRTALDAFLDS